MTDILLKIYHGLPTPLRSVVASVRGLYLRSWRYGPETDRLVEEAFEREDWNLDQWKSWKEERLAYVLHRAATQVPYYREQWATRRRDGDKASWEYLENWPILEKDSVRERPVAFVAEDCNVRKMFCEHTSGTTGKPMTLWWSLKTVREWYALAEARWRKWHGVTRHDRWIMLGGQLVTPVSQQRPPFWVFNKGLNQLYMSSYHLSPRLSKHYLDAIARYQPAYMMGYPSAMATLAQAVLESGRQDFQLVVAISNAEPLYDHQRAVIAEAFHCPVRDTYGMGEIVAHASECQAGSLHLWPEVGWVEVMDDGRVLVEDGNSGKLVCTGLFNADMPLIRYCVGDRGALASNLGRCQCGRTLPVIRSVEGRADDVIYTVDGRCIGRLDPMFKGNLPIREAQIIQEALDCIRVRYVPTSYFKANHENVIAQRLKARVGNVKVVMEPMAEIARGANGKFRSVICNIPKENRPVG
ncbi:MAG: phenylacetate--CoA ligase family protein [Nitrospira sp.]|nr:phenylacetate--CoA ligase family protein [Nitrospira sp.]